MTFQVKKRYGSSAFTEIARNVVAKMAKKIEEQRMESLLFLILPLALLRTAVSYLLFVLLDSVLCLSLYLVKEEKRWVAVEKGKEVE